MKRPRPQDARRDLRSMWSSVAVYSCADGTLRIEPTWRKGLDSPGMFTRMHSAYLIEAVLALPKKRINWKARVPDGKLCPHGWDTRLECGKCLEARSAAIHHEGKP